MPPPRVAAGSPSVIYSSDFSVGYLGDRRILIPWSLLQSPARQVQRMVQPRSGLAVLVGGADFWGRTENPLAIGQ